MKLQRPVREAEEAGTEAEAGHSEATEQMRERLAVSGGEGSEGLAGQKLKEEAGEGGEEEEEMAVDVDAGKSRDRVDV